MNERYNVPSLEKGMRVLEHLAEHSDGRSLRELVEDLGLPKTGVYRTVTTLTNLGYLDFNSKTGCYKLTKKLLALGNNTVCSENIIELAMEEMYNLRDACTETVQLNTIVGHQGVILEYIPALHPVRIMIDPGTRFELHAAAPGKVLLAFLPEAERNEILEQMEFQKYQETTITDKTEFLAELETVREKGYGTDCGESAVAVAMCVSAPIFDQKNYPVAALTITALDMRLSKEDIPRLVEMIVPCTQRISKRLGYGLL